MPATDRPSRGETMAPSHSETPVGLRLWHLLSKWSTR
jgi:hypothetical protein